jgi:hypothetical protein
VLDELGVAAVEHLLTELALHQGVRVLRGALSVGRRHQSDNAKHQHGLDDSDLHLSSPLDFAAMTVLPRAAAAVRRVNRGARAA